MLKNNPWGAVQGKGECTLSQKQGAVQTQWFFLFLGCIGYANLVNLIIVLATYKTYLDMVC
jgi:hypothetical protein